jgi:serine/threonine-protein kinase RsbW
MLFETALAEVGNNALVHGRSGAEQPVELVLRWEGSTVVAWVIDHGPPVGAHWVRDMPPATAEAGRGLALARSMLDALEYRRIGQTNRWRLVKKI